jgi:hypothetical protein
MIKKLCAAAIALGCLLGNAYAEDPSYGLWMSDFDCARTTYQSAVISYELPDDVIFLTSLDVANIKLTTAAVGGDEQSATKDQLFIRRNFFGLVLKLSRSGRPGTETVKLEGTVEVFQASKFCDLLKAGIYFRIQDGSEKIATVRLLATTPPTQTADYDARKLTLDRIGQKYGRELRYYLHHNFEWFSRDWLAASKITGSEAWGKFEQNSAHISGPATVCRDAYCDYVNAMRAQLQLLNFMERYHLHRLRIFDATQDFRLSEAAFSASVANRCLILGATNYTIELCIIKDLGMRLRTSSGFYPSGVFQ